MTNREAWNLACDDLESSQKFIDWTYLWLVSSALQRKVWMGSLPDALFSNLYIVFVGPPGIGKSRAATRAENMMLYDIPFLKTFPNITTREALIRLIAESTFTLTTREGDKVLDYAGRPITIAAAPVFNDELGTLLDSRSSDLVNILIKGYDCGRIDYAVKHGEKKRDKADRTYVTILGCTTPAWIQDGVNEKLFKDGFISRLLFVFASTKRKLVPNPYQTSMMREARQQVLNHILSLEHVYGEFLETEEAATWWVEWYHRKEMKARNCDPRMKSYIERLNIHMRKLAMVLHCSEPFQDLRITLEDYLRAEALLNELEPDMMDAFARVGRNVEHHIALSIEEALVNQPKKEMTMRDVITTFYRDADREQIDKALAWLEQVGKVVVSPGIGLSRIIRLA